MAVNVSLTSSEFVEALIRVAASKYRSASKTDLAAAVRKLLEEHIIPFAKRSDADKFRKHLKSDAMIQVISRHRERMKTVFAQRAGFDRSMSLREFTKMLRSCGAVNGRTFTMTNLVSASPCTRVVHCYVHGKP